MSWNFTLNPMNISPMKCWQRPIGWGQNQMILIPFLLMDQKLWVVQGEFNFTTLIECYICFCFTYSLWYLIFPSVCVWYIHAWVIYRHVSKMFSEKSSSIFLEFLAHRLSQIFLQRKCTFKLYCEFAVINVFTEKICLEITFFFYTAAESIWTNFAL